MDLPPAGIAHLYPGPGGTLLDSVFPPAGGTDATYLYQYTPEPAGTPPFLTSTAQPLIENLQVGKTATVTAGSWSSTPDSVSYQWYEDFAPIAGATGTTLVITPQLEGHRVFVVATASAAGYSDGVVTSAIGVEDWDWVEPGTLVSPVPTIAGKAAVGSKLTAEPGAWTPGTKLTYQWYEDAVPITGATQSTFVVPSALAGHTIRVDVAGTLRGYTSFDEISAATAKVPQSATFYANVLPALAGSDRYGTAIAISKASYPKSGSAKAVVIASGENFPDALSAASAAVKLGGPLLLTPHNALPSTVAAEVKRLGAKKIVMIGGTAAVSASVAASLQKIAPTVRISGADRYATSLAVAKYAFGSTSVRSVFFATGAAFPDALSAGAYAGADGMPVVLVPPIGTGLSPQLKSWLKSSHTLVFDVAGGEAAISSQMQEAIASATSDGPFTDFAGADRYDTNRRTIRQDGNPFSVATTAYVASGVNFPDALAGAAAAGLAADPLYLVESNCIPAATLSAMKTAGITTIQPLGGPAAVGSGVTHLKSCPG